MKHKISCSNNECIYKAYHNGCCLKIICIGKKGECVSFTTKNAFKDEPVVDNYTEIAKKLWTYICIIDDEKNTYEELADAIGLTDDELAFCRRLER